MHHNDHDEAAARGAIFRAVSELTRALQRGDYATAEEKAAAVLGGVQLLRAAARLGAGGAQIQLTEVEP